MEFEKLLESLGIEGETKEQLKSYVDTLNTNLEKKIKDATGKTSKVTEEHKAIVDKLTTLEKKYNAVIDAFEVDNNEEDIEKAISSAKEKQGVKVDVSTEQLKELQRAMKSLERESKQYKADYEKINEVYTAEKQKRISQVTKNQLLEGLKAIKAIKPEMLVDMFIGKAKFNENDESVSMIDTDGTDIGIKDYFSNWAEINPELIAVETQGGFGSGKSNAAQKQNKKGEDIVSLIYGDGEAGKNNTQKLNDIFKTS